MMCSEIDARTRDNPEAAMRHTQMPEWMHNAIARHIEEAGSKQVVMVNPDPHAKGQQGFDSATEREAMAAGGQLPAPHAEAIDRAAYDRFMRGLG
jgi:hypothetical protein